METSFSQKEADLKSSTIFLADLTIFLSDATYYLYGTTGDPKLGKNQGFLVYSSKNIEN